MIAVIVSPEAAATRRASLKINAPSSVKVETLFTLKISGRVNKADDVQVFYATKRCASSAGEEYGRAFGNMLIDEPVKRDHSGHFKTQRDHLFGGKPQKGRFCAYLVNAGIRASRTITFHG